MEEYNKIFVPSDLGRIEDCWWLLAKVIDYFDFDKKGSTIPKIKDNLKKILHEIHKKGTNSEFMFFTGYEQTIPSLLENMVNLQRMICQDERYSLTDSGKKTLATMENEVAEYCGVENLNDFLEGVNFFATLENASKIVASWPKWKQNILGPYSG